MSIRADFQVEVDEFIANLEEFATGSYLREDDCEFWEQPFDPAALPELRTILEAFLDELDALPADPDPDAVTSLVGATVNAIDAFNSKYADAIVEPEEREELNAMFRKAVAASPADTDAISPLLELE